MESAATHLMPVKLRRYPNRRYYDSARSQHLTLDEIFRLIADGHSIEVRDSKSGEDITPRVLAQLILEQAPSKWAALPAELFHQIIRANDALLRDFTDKYFHRALLAFEQSQREFENYLRHAMGLGQGLLNVNPALAPQWNAHWAGMMLAPFMQAFLAGGQVPSAGANQGSQSPERESVELKTELSELKQQIEELRKELRQR